VSFVSSEVSISSTLLSDFSDFLGVEESVVFFFDFSAAAGGGGGGGTPIPGGGYPQGGKLYGG